MTRLGWRMHEHCARKDELLDLEPLKVLQQSLGASHGDLLVQGTWLAGEIIIGGKVNHRCDPIAVSNMHPLERSFDSILRGQIDTDTFCGRGRRTRSHTVESHQGNARLELINERRTDEPAAVCYDYGSMLSGHHFAPAARVLPAWAYRKRDISPVQQSREGSESAAGHRSSPCLPSSSPWLRCSCPCNSPFDSSGS